MLRSAKTMPEFSQPASDGTLPANFDEWQRGVTYTVRPDIQAPLVRGREYRILTAVRRKIAKGEDFTGYGELYHRANAITAARIAGFAYPSEGELLHRWTMCHGWQRIDLGSANDLLMVFITTCLICAAEGTQKPQGEDPPSASQLRSPGGAFLETIHQVNTQPMDEIYIDFDHCDLPASPSDIVMFSYGEYVSTAKGIDFEPFVKRAGLRARFHCSFLNPEPREETLQILRREWFQ